MESIDFNIEIPGMDMVTMSFDSAGTFADVLKEVCRTYNLNPDDYQLRSDVEGSLPPETRVREAAVAPGTTLRLTRPPLGLPVQVLTHEASHTLHLSPAATLWEVYQKFMANKPNPSQPVEMSYHGHRFRGEKVLKRTSLSSLSRNPDQIVLQLERKWGERARSRDGGTNPDHGLPSVSKENAKTKESTQVHEKDSVASSISKSSISSLQGQENESRDMLINMTEVLPKPFVFPMQSGFLKGIATVDTNCYTGSKAKPKGIVNLDKRKGLTYSLKDKNIFGERGLALLGLKDDENKESWTGEKERERLRRSEEAQLRIVFPQQSVIQASFRTNETLGDVYQFVSSFTKSSNFNLCAEKDLRCDLHHSTRVRDLKTSPEGTLYVRYISDDWKIQPEPLAMEAIRRAAPRFERNKKIWKLK